MGGRIVDGDTPGVIEEFAEIDLDAYERLGTTRHGPGIIHPGNLPDFADAEIRVLSHMGGPCSIFDEWAKFPTGGAERLADLYGRMDESITEAGRAVAKIATLMYEHKTSPKRPSVKSAEWHRSRARARGKAIAKRRSR